MHSSDSRHRKPRVLVVDDEPSIHLAIEDVLELCHVESAMSASEARRRLHEPGEFDVALVDKNLPDCSGLALIPEIKRARPLAEVLVITGFPSMESAIDAMKLGASDYVPKPFDAHDLILKVTNASERSWLRRDLQESEQRHRELFEASPDAILMIDVESGRIVAANTAATRLYDCRRDELVGRCHSSLRATQPAPPIATSEPSEHLGITARTDRKAGGSTFPIEVTTTTTRVDGRAVAIEIIRDVSDRVRLETERRTLEERVVRSQCFEALGQLAGGVAHDFNNLLSVFVNSASLLESFLAQHQDKNLEHIDLAFEDVRNMQQAVEPATRLTRQLLGFSRRQIVSPEVVSVNHTVEELGSTCRSLIGSSVELRHDLAPDLSPVCIDLGQLEQLVVNLVVNARDAMPDGGTLTIATRNITAAATGQRSVQILVEDTGTGMSEELVAKIFEPFFTTKGPGRGTGLGLATVHNIVGQLGGEIRVLSKLNEGTQFEICLPAAARTRQTAVDVAVSAAAGQGERILLVEDCDIVRRTTARLLSRAGYAVRTARNGNDAAAQVDEMNEPDLLLTDVVMPGMPARALSDELARRWPRLKTLFMSSYAGDAIISRGLVRDSVEFLPKPFTEQRLLSSIRALLDDARQEPRP